MGRRRGISVALAAAICGLAVPLAARAQAPPLPARCQAPSQAVKPPALELFIDQLVLTGADLPANESPDQFVAMLEQSAGSGTSGWLGRVWDAARTAWQDRGYFQAVVNVRTLTERVEDGVRHVRLRIRIDPGPLYRIEEVRVLDVNPGGKLVFSNERLRDLIPLRPGEAVDVGKAEAGVEAIRNLYASHGYIDLQATPSFQIQDGPDLISLFVMLDQGEQYRVGKIDVLGFGATGQSLLKAKIKPGDVFDWNVVKDFYSGNQWLMPPGASVSDDRIDREAKTHTVNLLLDFRACPKPAKPGAAGEHVGRSQLTREQ
jgi:outer membrane translocation and assembly module TamA